MQIKLYNCTSQPNVVHKKKTLLNTLNGTLKENVNRESVIVTVPYFSGWEAINYAEIPDFKRFYYVSVECLAGVRLRLTMHSDALSSFWDNYKVSQCIAKRSTSDYNTMIKDDMIAFSPQTEIIRRKTRDKFQPSSTGGCYILTVTGK